MSTIADDFLHRTYKSTNVSTPTSKLWRVDEQCESSDESYSEETIIKVDNLTEENNHMSDKSLSIPIVTTETEISLPDSKGNTNVIKKHVMSEGEVLQKKGRLHRILCSLQLRKRSQSSPQTNALDNTSASTSQPNLPQTEVRLVGAETPLSKDNKEIKKDVKKDVTKVTGENTNQHFTQGSRRSFRQFFNTGRMKH